MLDDDKDKTVARNQVIALVLMTLLLVVWFRFFMPKPVPVQPDTGDQAGDTTTEYPSEPPAGDDAGPQGGAQDAWPFLPAVATQTDPSEDEIVLEDDDLRLVFTRVGARLKRATVKLHNHGESEVQLVPEPLAPADPEAPGVSDADVPLPLGLRFSDEDLGAELNRRRFDVEEDAAGRAVTFTLRWGAARVTKRFALTDVPHLVDIQVDYENLEENTRKFGIDETPAYWLAWEPNFATTVAMRRGLQQFLIWRKDGSNTFKKTGKLESNGPVDEANPEWIALRRSYFLVAFEPGFEDARAWARGSDGRVQFGLAASRFAVESGEVDSRRFRMYVGPCQTSNLAAAWDTLPSAMRFFVSVDIMDKFSRLLLALLNWFYSVIPNYGVAIILLTVLARVCMFPLTLKSMKSMKRMQSLAPAMEELKVKYKDDPQELQKKTMEMYRERGVNPLGGCLPMLLQMPVFVALYRMLWTAFELRGAPFVLVRFGDYAWVRDLSEPDQLLHLPFMADLPLVGMFEYFNLLPILMALAMVLHQKIMPTSGPAQNDQQKLIMTIMPVFFAFICYNMASGLNLYIFTSTMLGIAQSKLMPTSKGEPPPVKKRTPKKKQHFYAAAQARKRRLTKETKDTGKRASSGRGKGTGATKRSGKKTGH